MDKEHYYDKVLNIKTAFKPMRVPKNKHYHPYEPTPYEGLEALFKAYEIRHKGRIVDFGCGMGRINFYLHYFFKVSVIGVEMNEGLYSSAKENLKGYAKKYKVSNEELQFFNCQAEDYAITPLDSQFYFFNPFSIEVFKRIVNHILVSYEEAPREMDVLLYYPSENYTYFLEDQTPFQLKEEIVLRELYKNNPYERFLIYTFG
ncbi:SAM-dependent methyltransferase [Pullulanibacillus pueri]|uniref:Methyltransferase n=1 Tax=Pullulanibacillus pueri TaxID=1437324 RepID=A0A8J2ZYL2_9BACL|nr:methyltransferase [Pullulanibacillus pueri]MBM7680980.1 SAM-dependent methyltransferase [Pullulanibacillus pueri]GGH86210.1 methyltransferase [Pullulanibacillus pueri]